MGINPGDWAALYGEKRYHTLNHYLKQRFGGKVFKLSLDAGFTCPNRDGSKGFGGCRFCSARGSGDFAPPEQLSLTEQLRQGVALVEKKWPSGQYIAYFQAFTNTYAPLAVLQARYDEALRFPGVIGMAVATRPDCLPEEVCDLLAAYREKTFLWVELGLQSVHADTMRRMNLQYTYADYLAAAERLRRRGIPFCVHLIVGLPGEDRQMILQSAEAVCRTHPFGLKLHMLHVLQGTRLGLEYERKPFPLLTMEEYVPLIADLLERIPPEVIIHRLTGDGPKALTLAPRWTFHKLKVLSEIDRELKRRDSWQGKLAAEAGETR